MASKKQCRKEDIPEECFELMKTTISRICCYLDILEERIEWIEDRLEAFEKKTKKEKKNEVPKKNSKKVRAK
jgi:hypothetical protein